MKDFLLFIMILVALGSCSQDEAILESQEEAIEPIADVRMFVFGHSLINHELLVNQSTPSNETSVLHWMHFLALSANVEFAADGQYGFLGQHRNLPPIAQWGFDHVTSIWDSDVQDFHEANFNTILLTAGNFIQYQPANENYYNEDFSPVDATVEIFEWCNAQEEEINVYIYENWPDMAPFLSGDFEDITQEELQSYYEYTLGDFNQWWLNYHDWVIEEIPNVNVKMIPVGPILSTLMTELDELADIPVTTDLYEDDAPHGRPTIYFLAGLITYMAIYQTEAPMSYPIPATVHNNVRTNYAEISAIIWNELERFHFDDGTSRVW